MKMMKTLTAVAALTIGTAAFGSTANAEIKAFASLVTKNVEFFDTDTGATVTAGSFDNLFARVDVGDSATLNGVTDSDAAFATFNNGVTTGNLANVDATQSVVGNPVPPAGENNFSTGNVEAIGGTFARADAQATGTAIDFGGGGGDAVGSTQAQVNLAAPGPQDGSGVANLTNVSEFAFSTGTGGSFQLQFDAEGRLFTSAGTEDVNPAAQANFSFVLEILAETAPGVFTTVLEWTPNGSLDNSFGANTIGATELGDAADLETGRQVFQAGQTSELAAFDTGALQAFIVDFDLDPGSYQLRVTQNVSVGASGEIPAPATLGLLGAGLILAGAAWRRRRQQAQA